MDKSEDSESNRKELLRNVILEGYTSLKVSVPNQDTNNINSYELQKLRTAGKKCWRGKGRRGDLVWVHLRKMKVPAASGYQQVLSYPGPAASFLNALFIMH